MSNYHITEHSTPIAGTPLWPNYKLQTYFIFERSTPLAGTPLWPNYKLQKYFTRERSTPLAGTPLRLYIFATVEAAPLLIDVWKCLRKCSSGKQGWAFFSQCMLPRHALRLCEQASLRTQRMLASSSSSAPSAWAAAAVHEARIEANHFPDPRFMDELPLLESQKPRNASMTSDCARHMLKAFIYHVR